MSVDGETYDARAAESVAAPGRLSLFGERHVLGTALKALLSIGAVAFILYTVGIDQLAHNLGRLNLAWLALAAACVFACVAISAWKWLVTARAAGLRASFGDLLRYYFMGFFFNNFLPSSVGGDVVRIWKLARTREEMPASAASVIGERLVALATPTALLGIAWCSLPTSLSKAAVWAATLIPTVAGVALMALVRKPELGEKTMRNAAGTQFGAVKTWTVQAAREMGAFVRNPRAMTQTVALTALFHVAVAGVNYCLLRGLGVSLNPAEALVYTSVALAVSMLPISIAGHGIREAAYWYFFGLAGVPKADAVLTSLLFAVLVALLTLPGALLFVIDRKGAAHER